MATAMMGVFDRSYVAETDLTGKQFYIVELTGTDQVDVCDGAGDVPLGVLLNKPDVGQAATVQEAGVAKVVSDGTENGGITVGSPVGTDATGKAVRKSANNDYILGTALDASAADGIVIRVDLTRKGQLGA